MKKLKNLKVVVVWELNWEEKKIVVRDLFLEVFLLLFNIVLLNVCIICVKIKFNFYEV